MPSRYRSLRGFGRQCPEPAHRIDRGHPLAKQLVLAALLQEAGSTNYFDHALYQPTASTTGPPGAAACPLTGGLAADFGTGAKEIRFARKGPNLFGSPNVPITIFALIYPTAPNSGGTILGVGETADTNSAFEFGTVPPNVGVTTAGDLVCSNDSVNNNTSVIDSTLLVTANKWQFVAVSQSGTSSRTFLISQVGGTLSIATNTVSIATTAIGSTEPWYLGRGYENGGLVASTDFQGRIAFVYVWSRALANQELLWLVQEPFAFFNPQAPRKIAKSSGTTTFTVTPAGGLLLGGFGSPSTIFGPMPTAGGPLVGGSATATPIFPVTPAGGVVLGGTATATPVFTVAAASGPVLGGSALPPGVIFAPPAAGGPIIGGTALPPAVAFNPSAGGGLLLGGSSLPPGVTFSPVPAGGVLLGGSASPSLTATISPAGGPVIGGTASASLVTTGGSFNGGMPLSTRMRGWGRRKPGPGYSVESRSPLAKQAGAFWTLSENGGLTAYNLWRSSYPFTLTDRAMWAAGPFGGASLSFNGTTQYGTTAQQYSAAIGAPVSLAAWVNTNTLTNQGAGFYRRVLVLGANQAFCMVANAGKPTCYYLPNGGGQTELDAPSALTVGTWTHIAITYDGSTITIYVNGAQVASASSVTLAAITSGSILLGIHTDLASGGWSGSIDSPGFWPRALTAGEVLTLASQPFAMIQSAPPARIRGTAPTSFTVTPGGGLVLGGTATASPTFTPPAGAGGPVLGGTATATPIFRPPVSGGALLGGTATPSFIATANTAGGPVVGGTAPPSLNLTITPAGGPIIGGTAPASSNQTFTATPAGGVLVGGTAVATPIFTPPAAGGPVVGGSAAPGVTFKPTVSGGLVVGGHAIASALYSLTTAATTLRDLLTGIRNHLINDGITTSPQCVISLFNEPFPLGGSPANAPFIFITPGEFLTLNEQVDGAGRYLSGLRGTVYVNVVVRNALDVRGQDLQLLTHLATGIYLAVDPVVNDLEYQFVTDTIGNFITEEPLRLVAKAAPKRYQHANEWAGVRLSFEAIWWLNLTVPELAVVNPVAETVTDISGLVTAIRNLIVNNNVFNANQCVVSLDYEIQPTFGAPFAIVSPGDASAIREQSDGAGRYLAGFTQAFTVTVAVRNMQDIGDFDTQLLTSTDNTIGLLTKMHKVIDLLHLSFLTDGSGNLITEEPIRLTKIAAPKRMKVGGKDGNDGKGGNVAREYGLVSLVFETKYSFVLQSPFV